MSGPNDLDRIRRQIATVDSRIESLLAERARLVGLDPRLTEDAESVSGKARKTEGEKVSRGKKEKTGEL